MIPDSREPFWGYQDLALFLGSGLPSILGASVLIAGIEYLAGELDRPAEVLLLQLFAYLIWFAALWAILRLRHGQPFWHSLGWHIRRMELLSWAALGPLLAAALIIVSAFLGMPKVNTPMGELLRSEWALFLIGGFATTLGPVCEELGFRGFLMPLLMRTFGEAAGIVLAAVPFALLHGPEYAWSWRHVALVGIAGAAFGWARFKTGSTAAAAAMHATYNLTLFAGLIYQGEYLNA